MIKSRKKLFGIVVGILLAALLVTTWNPKIRTNLFVRLYHEDIEESLTLGMGVPADDAVLFGYKYVNTWEGEHSMTEFLIAASGFVPESTYYGCYYSPDDVPLAFQNLDTVLVRKVIPGHGWAKVTTAVLQQKSWIIGITLKLLFNSERRFIWLIRTRSHQSTRICLHICAWALL